MASISLCYLMIFVLLAIFLLYQKTATENFIPSTCFSSHFAPFTPSSTYFSDQVTTYSPSWIPRSRHFDQDYRPVTHLGQNYTFPPQQLSQRWGRTWNQASQTLSPAPVRVPSDALLPQIPQAQQAQAQQDQTQAQLAKILAEQAQQDQTQAQLAKILAEQAQQAQTQAQLAKILAEQSQQPQLQQDQIQAEQTQAQLDQLAKILSEQTPVQQDQTQQTQTQAQQPGITQPKASNTTDQSNTITQANCDPGVPTEGVKPEGSTGLTTQEQDNITQIHNDYRAFHGMAPLTFDSALAEDAQKWAEKLVKDGCQLKHDPSLSQLKQGENLASYSGQQSQTLDPVKAWYSERCDYEKLGDYQNPTKERSPATGHFTQVVWKDTNRVGCGYATCGDGKKQLWVCRYGPPGNYVIMKQGESFDAARARVYQENVVRPS